MRMISSNGLKLGGDLGTRLHTLNTPLQFNGLLHHKNNISIRMSCIPQSLAHLNHGNKQCFETACHITLQLSTKLWRGGKREGGEKRREKGRGKRTILKKEWQQWCTLCLKKVSINLHIHESSNISTKVC